jgi:hypothetical protein
MNQQVLDKSSICGFIENYQQKKKMHHNLDIILHWELQKLHPTST